MQPQASRARRLFRRVVPLSLRRSPVMQRWRFAPAILSYAVTRRLYAAVPGRVLLLSGSRATLSGNLEFIADQLIADGRADQLHTCLQPTISVSMPWRQVWLLTKEVARAEVVVLDDYYPLLYSLHLRAGTGVVQVWHAAGAFKRVGFSRAGLPGDPIPGSNVHRGYTAAIVSAPDLRSDYAEAFGLPLERVRALGVPRTDAFFDEDSVERTRAEVRSRLGIADGVRVALFAPTFRGHGARTAHYDFTLVDWAQVAAQLGDQWVMAVKMHPFVAAELPEQMEDDFFLDVSHEREITELLMAADLVITDYSSLIFEYGLLARPIVMLVPDLEQYISDRSFYYPFEDYVYGAVARTTTELIEAIRDGLVDPARHAAFLERFMASCDGQSTRRVVDQLLTGPE